MSTSRGRPLVDLQAYQHDSWIRSRDPFDHGPGIIMRGIVDNDDLDLIGVRFSETASHCTVDEVGAVEGRDHERETRI